MADIEHLPGGCQNVWIVAEGDGTDRRLRLFLDEEAAHAAHVVAMRTDDTATLLTFQVYVAADGSLNLSNIVAPFSLRRR